MRLPYLIALLNGLSNGSKNEIRVFSNRIVWTVVPFLESLGRHQVSYGDMAFHASFAVWCLDNEVEGSVVLPIARG